MELGRLKLIYPGGRQQEIVLTKSLFNIGRARDNDLVLDDPAVSKNHARLIHASNGWKILDLGSANGTYVDGERLSPMGGRRLIIGSGIRIGRMYIVLEPPPEDQAIFAEMSSLLESAATEESTVASTEIQTTERARTLVEPISSTSDVAAQETALQASLSPDEALDSSRAGLQRRASVANILADLTTAERLQPDENTGAVSAFASGQPPETNRGSWRLSIAYPDGQRREIELTGNKFSIGRAKSNTLVLDQAAVSKYHAQLIYSGGVWKILDLGSAKGTVVDGERLVVQTMRHLKDGSIIQIGDFQMLLSRQTWKLCLTYRNGRRQEVEIVNDPFTIGRAADNDLVISEGLVSNYHAQLLHESNGWHIIDMGSTDGTYVDSVRLLPQDPQILTERTIVQIGGTRISVQLGRIVAKSDEQPISLLSTPLEPVPAQEREPEPQPAPIVIEPAEPVPALPEPPPPKLSWWQRTVRWLRGQPRSPSSTVAPGPVSTPPASGSSGKPLASSTTAPVPAAWVTTVPASSTTAPAWSPAPSTTQSMLPADTRGFGPGGSLANSSGVQMTVLNPVRRVMFSVFNALGLYQLRRFLALWGIQEPEFLSNIDKPSSWMAGRGRSGASSETTALATVAQPLPWTASVTPSGTAVLDIQRAAQPLPALRESELIQVTISADSLVVHAGQTVSTTISIINRAKVVDRISISIGGLPEQWVTISPPSVSLFPGGRGEIQLAISPPRLSSSLAGIHSFVVVAISEQNPSEQPINRGALAILPYSEFKLDLLPRQQGCWRRANYYMAINNTGNQSQTFQLYGRDEEDKIDFAFVPPQPVVNPGETRRVRVGVRHRHRRWFGTAKTSLLNLTAAPTDGAIPPQDVLGRVTQQAIFSPGVIIVLGMLLLAFLAPHIIKYYNSILAPATPTPETVIVPTIELPPTIEPEPTQEPILIVDPPTEEPLPTEEPFVEPSPLPTELPPTPPPPTEAPPSPLPSPIPTPVADLVFNGEPLMITGNAWPFAELLLYFDGRAVGGGVADANGNFALRLIIDPTREQAGVHDVMVRVRGTSRTLVQRTVYIP